MGANNEVDYGVSNLSDFVSATILEIANGLNDAQYKGSDSGVKILPEEYEDISSPLKIDFDLSVTSITHEKGASGVAVQVIGFGVNFGKENTGSIEALNRIHFTLPVNYVIYNRGACEIYSRRLRICTSYWVIV